MSAMAEWDPWVHLEREAPDVEVVWANLPHTNGAYVPSHRTIVLRNGQTRSAERSALAEELAHHELGHEPVEDPVEVARSELRARRWAANRLITVDRLVEGIVHATTWFDVAEWLEVDPDLLDLYIRDITDAERREVWRRVGRRELGL